MSAYSYIIGRVKSIALKEGDDGWENPMDMGKITFQLVYSSISISLGADAAVQPAYPMFNFVRQYPLLNEMVLVIPGPTEALNDARSRQKFFYYPPYALWNKSNHGAFPDLREWEEFVNTKVNQPSYSGAAVQPPRLPLGKTFKENTQIRDLQSFEGDCILQARSGQSIRFGSTVPEMKDMNKWSSSGNSGDPITIIQNSQGPRPGVPDYKTITEDINKDGSAIYLTTTQEIVMDIGLFPLNSFGNNIFTENVAMLANVPTSNYAESAQQQDQNNRTA